MGSWISSAVTAKFGTAIESIAFAEIATRAICRGSGKQAAVAKIGKI
jgi:hypothetical protein